MNDDIFETILDQDETWFVIHTGAAMLVNDVSLMDC